MSTRRPDLPGVVLLSAAFPVQHLPGELRALGVTRSADAIAGSADGGVCRPVAVEAARLTYPEHRAAFVTEEVRLSQIHQAVHATADTISAAQTSLFQERSAPCDD